MRLTEIVVVFCSAMAANVAVAQRSYTANATHERSTSEAETFRGQLGQRGVTFGLAYTAEVFSALRGGVRQGSRSEYLGSLALSWPDGRPVARRKRSSRPMQL